MDETSKRTSTIPRPSRLPVGRPTSSIPRPASTTPRPNSTVRHLASRDSLPASAGAVRETPTKNPRLRSSVSRDQLHSSTLNQGRTTRLRNSTSREQLSSDRTPRAAPSRASHTPTTTPHRRTSVAPSGVHGHDGTTLAEPVPPEDHDCLFKRRMALTRRPSESLPGPPYWDVLNANDTSSVAIQDDFPAPDAVQSTPGKGRPSLSERTVETLARIPSSPALRKKSSSFFDQARPSSRAGVGNSRPGSSHMSDGSGRISSRAPSRPGSSSGHEEPNPRSSANLLRAPLSTIEATPPARAPGTPSTKTRVVRKTASRSSLTPASSLAAPGATTPSRAETKSPARKPYGSLAPKSGSKTVSSRPSKPRASAAHVFRKPSLPAIDMAAANSETSRHTSHDSAQSSITSWDGTIKNQTTESSPNTSATDAQESPKAASMRKSSAALRDQIAKAKAAKRAAAKQSTLAQHSSAEGEVPIIPSDDGFDFGTAYTSDPFNLRKGENPQKKLLEQKVRAARSSGRLNIAALGLSEMPTEVIKMYDLESIGANDGSWAESVDLTRFVAADNELEKLDDFIFPDSDPNELNEDDTYQGSMFAGLETIDLHNNLFVDVPLGFRRLGQITSLNLSSNRLTNNSLDTISQMTSLRDLKLAKNLFFGPLNPAMSNLSSLEILDLHGNNVSALPLHVNRMARLRILNLSENSFESLPFEDLAKLPLTELQLRKNKLSGTLIGDSIDALPGLQTLDASSNQLERLVPLGALISLPVLHALSLSMNRLQGLPDMTTWSSLLTLTVDENNISGIPNSFTTLEKLRHADFSSNDIRVVPPEIARMDNLTMIRLSGNPLRDKKFVSITTEELKDALAARLEPPPPYQGPDHGNQDYLPGFLTEATAEVGASAAPQPAPDDAGEDSRSDMDDDFATPPTSVQHSPAASLSLRSRSRTLSNQIWPIKQGGLLDRSRTDSASLHPVVCSKVAAEYRVKQVMLHHNLFPSLPNSLSFFAETLVTLSLASNQLVGETYLAEDLDFPVLQELNLASNRITGLGPLVEHLHAPALEKLDVSVNRINALPWDLKGAFPALKILLASNNQIPELEPEMIKGLKMVDASSNDISKLNPKLGLLGGTGGLERLDVMGNRFRVPRWNVLERGTEATLRWLRGRVPVAEMAAWKGENDDEFADVD